MYPLYVLQYFGLLWGRDSYLRAISLLETEASGTSGGDGTGLRRPHFPLGHGLYYAGRDFFNTEDGERSADGP